jgi:hypothetical protein
MPECRGLCARCNCQMVTGRLSCGWMRPGAWSPSWSPRAERLPGRYVVPGLVDAHAHPAVGREAGMPVALDGSEALNVLAAWAACGVCLVRDTGSAGGSVLELDLVPGMPRL